MRRRVRRYGGLAAALVVAAALVLTGSPAHAHANLVGTSPANGSQLDEPPAEVRLQFSERVSVALNGIALRTADGTEIGTEPAEPDPADPTTVVLPIPADLADGSYLVTFRVVSADSHPIAGALVFGIGVPAAPVSEIDFSDEDPAVATVFAAARWTGYAGLALLAGVLVFLSLCWPAGWTNRRARRVAFAGWAVSLAGAVAVLLLQGPYSAGRSLGELADPELLSTTLDTDYGRYVLVRLALVLIAGGLLFAAPRLARWRTPAALAVGVALAATWRGTGHANAEGNPLDAIADLAHLVAMSSWFGGLALLAICLLPRGNGLPPSEVTGAVRRFSLLATVAVGTLVVTGVYVAWRRVGSFDALLGTPYGRLLAFKLAAMGVLLWLGSMSRSVVQRRYANQAKEAEPSEAAPVAAAKVHPASKARVVTETRSKRRSAKAAVEAEQAARAQLRGSVRLEVVAAVGVLALASVLVATPPGAVVTAGEALAAQAAEAETGAGAATTGPVAEQVLFEDDELVVQVLVDPARVGGNLVSIAITDMGFAPREVPEVRASFVLPDGDGTAIGPLPVELTPIPSAPGEYEARDAQLPTAGTWRLDVVVRTTEIDSVTAQVEIPVA
jgi:copper transport protein